MRYALKKWSKKVDLVHAHWLIPQGIMQATIKTTPYIVTGHGGDVTSLNIPIMKQMKRKCLQNAKAITVVSEALRGYVMDMYPNSKTSIVSMGCNTKNFSSSLRKEDYFAQGEKKVILFVGRLAEKKGVTYLIEAMKNIDHAVLHIVGKGNLEDDLRVQAESLQDRVVFDGAKNHEELPAIYASADVFVAPSITARDGDKEGFGLVILEAMASGVPVVASNSGGIPDIIQHQENGLLTREKDPLDIAEKINLILNDDALKERLVAQGFQTAKMYDYETIAEKYHDIFERG
jgi:glycosyltransferase involved in cell wall biosynthesis